MTRVHVSDRLKEANVKKTLIFTSGMALGYIAGTKAGTERYQQIVSAVRLLGERTGWWQRAEPAAVRAPSVAPLAPSVPPNATLYAATASAEQLSAPAGSTRPPAP